MQTRVLGTICLYFVTCFLPSAVRAAIPSIQVSPLKYQDSLVGSTSKLGFVDVSNPSDSTITLHSEVQAFRQINLSGDLQFYQDDAVSQGIIVSATDFDLGPREANRIAFTINPQKLPKGGVYAAIFFSTTPKPSSAGGTVIMQSAKAGTLLILDNGGAGKKTGRINSQVPWFQFGSGLAGTLNYTNTGKTPSAIAFNPAIGVKAFWWGNRNYINGPLVFPGNTRQFDFNKRGNYIGLVPILFNDKDTGQQTARIVFAITGLWRLVALVALLTLAAAVFWYFFAKKKHA